jgi:hypothetical protein
VPGQQAQPLAVTEATVLCLAVNGEPGRPAPNRQSAGVADAQRAHAGQVLELVRGRQRLERVAGQGCA